MRTYFAAPAALLLVLMMGYIPSSRAADPEEARAALVKTTRDYAAALKSHDFARIQSFYAADVAIYGPGFLLKGIEAVQKLQQSDNADHSRDVFELSSDTLELAKAGDLAYTTGTYRVSHADGREADVGKFVAIWEMQDTGNWALAVDVFTPDVVSNPVP